MGQTIGRSPLPPGCKRFLNLPRSCIYDLWEAFNDIAEGFGLTVEEFQEIIKSALMEHLSVTERTLNADTDAIFRCFDDDENNLVDSLEFLSSFALLSGMTPEEKIKCEYSPPSDLRPQCLPAMHLLSLISLPRQSSLPCTTLTRRKF